MERGRIIDMIAARGGRRAIAGKIQQYWAFKEPHVSSQVAIRTTARRADQRLVLRPAQPRLRDYLRPARHHQRRAGHLLHDGRIQFVDAAATISASAIGPRWCWRLSLVGLIGMAIERTLLISQFIKLDHIYGLAADLWPYDVHHRDLSSGSIAHSRPALPGPARMRGGFDLGFMFLPKYRAWVVLIASMFCFATWYAIEKTPIGRTLRAATENPKLTRAFGVNVPALMTFGFGVGVALAGVAGVMAAPIYQVSPLMGGDLVIVMFAVVVVGGMGSILGAIVTSIFTRPARRTGQGGLPAGCEHGDLRHHDRRPTGKARRPVRTRTMSDTADTTLTTVAPQSACRIAQCRALLSTRSRLLFSSRHRFLPIRCSL